MKRHKINNRTSKRVFKHTASMTHRRNNGAGSVMRGGIRL